MLGKSAEQKLREQISREEFGIRWRCEEAVKQGCSQEAANFVASRYENGKISEANALTLVQNLYYANNISELQKRFRVQEKPEEATKQNCDAEYGAIAGDILGSRFEGRKIQNPAEIWNRWEEGALSDDSILTLGTSHVLKRNEKPALIRRKMRAEDIARESGYPLEYNPFTAEYKHMAHLYPEAGFSGRFRIWALGKETHPYGSLGNGSAMRVSPIGARFDRQEQVIFHATASAMSSHNHIEGVKGAVVTAMCIWMARKGYSKRQIFGYMKQHYSYGEVLFTEFTYKEAQAILNCQGECSYSVPAAVISFCSSDSFRDAIEKAVCIGLDTDTNACICGGMAGAYYGVEYEIKKTVDRKLEEIQEKL